MLRPVLFLVVLGTSKSEGGSRVSLAMEFALPGEETCNSDVWDNVCKDDNFKARFTDVSFAGAGASACVWFAKDVENGNVAVAVKVSKEQGFSKLLDWKAECGAMHMLRLDACANSLQLLEISEAFHTNCLGVSSAVDYPFMVQHAAPRTPVDQLGIYGIPDEAKITLSPDMQKFVFAQFVAAVYGLHAIGKAHNDLHGKNIVVSDSSPWHLALIDFGDVTPLAEAKSPNYKRDGYAIWLWTAHLANCEEDATIEINESPDNMRLKKDKFLSCLESKWGAGEEQFKNAFSAIIDADISTNAGTWVEDQHVKDLYETSFVQKILEDREADWKVATFNWKGADNCRSWSPSDFQRKKDEAMYSDKFQCETVPTFSELLCPVHQIACFSTVEGVNWACIEGDDIDPKLKCTDQALPPPDDSMNYEGACIMKAHRGWEFALNYTKATPPDSSKPTPASTGTTTAPGSAPTNTDSPTTPGSIPTNTDALTTSPEVSTSLDASTTKKEDSGGMNGGVVAAIIVAALALVLAGAGAAYYSYGRRQADARRVAESFPATEMAGSFTA
mmetsp:Transcript_50178/g.79479  ORF Transcript_50178/g.79479 Transcript_50178/m.79479 type:complete len:559 (-) Transcript_50178:46-1722(-)